MNSTKKHKLNIFSFLGNITKKDKTTFSKLSEDEKKEVQPLIVMRWLTGTSSMRQIYFINELVNPFVFSLFKHKHLLISLMMVCTSGKFQRYKWIKKTATNQSNYPKCLAVIKDYFNYSTTEAIDVLPILKKDDIITYAEELGRQQDEIKIIQKELK